MGIHGAARDPQLRGNFFILTTFGEHLDDFEFPVRESRDISPNVTLTTPVSV